jgi:lipopolysaccharide transport system permease protein
MARPLQKEITISARSKPMSIDWLELWRARELFYFLMLRDVKVRYKQTVLGVLWAFIQPLATMLIFTLIFGQLARLPSEGAPYAPFVLAGMLPWAFFSTVVTQASLSLLNQQALLTKVYMPRLLIPTSCTGSAAVDFSISLVLLFMLSYYYDIRFSVSVLAIPALMGICALAATGLGVGLAALSVVYRDFKYVTPFLIQCLFFLSPVVYPTSLVPDRWQWILSINPMVGVIDGFRSALFGHPWNWHGLAFALASAVAIALAGLLMFRATERRFADLA